MMAEREVYLEINDTVDEEKSKQSDNRGVKRNVNVSDSQLKIKGSKIRRLKEPNLKSTYFHTINLAENLWRMRDTGTLCDVQFQIGPNKASVVCHKNVLMVASQYFQKIFAYEKEGLVHLSKDGVHTNILDKINVPFDKEDVDHGHHNIMGTSIIYVDKEGTDQISKDVVNAALRFIYCGTLPDGVDSIIPSIFALADIWLLQELKVICIEKMVKDASASNFQQLLRFAEKYDILELSRVVQDFIARYLPHIYQTEEFDKLKEADIKDMLNKPLTYHHEDLICIKALKNWCKDSQKKFHYVLEMVKLDLFTKVQLQNISNCCMVQEEKDFKLRVIKALEIGNEPLSVQYFPLIKTDIDNLIPNTKMDLGSIVDFRKKMIITKPIKINNNVIINFICPFGKKISDRIRFHSQVCYKNTIYASVSFDCVKSNLEIPIFTYSLVQGTAKPLACDIIKMVPQWIGRGIIKMLHLQDNHLFCSAFNGQRRSFIVIKVDLDNEDRKWEIILHRKLRVQNLTELEPRLIRVDQDAIFVRLENEPHCGVTRQRILKFLRDNALGDNAWQLKQLTQFPFIGDSVKKTSDEFFYDFNGKRLFVFEHEGRQALGKLFVYDFADNEWTKLPPVEKMKKLISIRLEDNKLYVIGVKDCYDVCKVLDMETQMWGHLDICDTNLKALPFSMHVRWMQSRGYPATRFLLCKDETESESEEEQSEADDEKGPDKFTIEDLPSL